MKVRINAESGLSLLIVIALFAFLCLTLIKWQAVQNQRFIAIFQQQQALQIAENQIALKMANMPCESQFRQNNINYTINCDANITIHFPSGKVGIERNL